MAERATEPETGHNEVVDLNNDARWQARLEEARARRAEALKRKGLDEKPKRVPSKPWEDEANTAIEAERHQRALDDDGLDFHDRMNALQKVLKDKQPAPEVASEMPAATQNWSADATPDVVEPVVTPKPAPPEATLGKVEAAGPPVDSFFEDPEFREAESAESDNAEPEFIPMEALVDPLPPVRGAPTRRPWIEEAEVEEAKSEVVAADVEPAPMVRKSEGMPFFLGIGLVALVAMPFFTLLPPMTRGPEAALGPVFGMQPAFGITAAMVEFPVATQSGEFVPTSKVAPGGPLKADDGTAPLFSRVIPELAAAPVAEAFEMPAVSERADVNVALVARADLPAFEVTQAMREAADGVADGVARLPDVLATVGADSLVPIPRP